MIHKPNFFVFRGGPSAGKTALIRHLESLGERVVEESIRAVIREEPTERGSEAMFRRAADRDICAFDALREEQGRVFFDRGLMD